MSGHHPDHRPLIHVPVTRALLDAAEEAGAWMRKHGKAGNLGAWLDAHKDHRQHEAMERLGHDGDHDNATWGEVLDEVRRVAPALSLSKTQREILARATVNEDRETGLLGSGQCQSARGLCKRRLGRMSIAPGSGMRVFEVNDAGRREHARQEAMDAALRAAVLASYREAAPATGYYERVVTDRIKVAHSPNGNAKRPWLAYLDGSMLRTGGGVGRRFATEDAAVTAAEKKQTS